MLLLNVACYSTVFNGVCNAPLLLHVLLLSKCFSTLMFFRRITLPFQHRFTISAPLTSSMINTNSCLNIVSFTIKVLSQGRN